MNIVCKPPRGEIVWLQDSAVRLENDEGKPVLIQGVMTDITDLKQAESHLAQRASQLATLFQFSQDIVATLDLEQVYLAAHRGVENLMPTEAFFISLVNEEEQILQDVYLFDEGKRWPNENTPLSERGITAQVYQTGTSLWIEDDADGTSERYGRELFGTLNDTRSVLIAPLKLREKVIGLISTQHYQPFMYSSDHLQMLETLANQIAVAIDHARLIQSLRLQAVALDAAANAILITDREGMIQWANPAFTKLTGFSIQEAIGKKLPFYVPGTTITRSINNCGTPFAQAKFGKERSPISAKMAVYILKNK